MITIIRGEEKRVVSTLFCDELQEGDLVGIDDIHEVASNMDEYLEFMENAFTIGFNVVSGDLDSRKAIGKVMLNVCAGLAEYNRRVFQKQ
jgi:Holliday junction resolvasome RuvABC ATP-dependent DNA helicase subunit